LLLLCVGWGGRCAAGPGEGLRRQAALLWLLGPEEEKRSAGPMEARAGLLWLLGYWARVAS
jgi:hypothetical protein